MSAIRASAFGWIGTGYWNYAGTSTDGITFNGGTTAGDIQWWNDGAMVDAQKRIVVGEAGAIASSSDGVKWNMVTTPKKEDLYAVTFRGARGAAVGAHGTVLVTADSGGTWTDHSTGLDSFLGGVRFVDDTTLLVVGEHGAVLRTSL